MSFAGEIREEIAKTMPKSRHCRMAELAAFFEFLAEFGDERNQTLSLKTENVNLAKKVLLLIKKDFEGKAELVIGSGRGSSHSYQIRIDDPADAQSLLERVGHDRDQSWREQVRRRDCCRRAYIRAAFLSAGTISDPGKSYHFEIACPKAEDAAYLTELFETFSIACKTMQRRGRPVIYLKDSTAITDALNLMGAFRCSMQMENVRILKDIRNNANRQSNCDAANITKQVKSAERDVEDIRQIEERMGLNELKPALREVAWARLEHPDASLAELGEYLDPPVGKSGIRYRLQKIAQIAEELRNE